MSAEDATGAGGHEMDDTVMAMITKMAEQQAGQEQAQSRQLSASEEALMKKLQKGKTTKEQKLIEQAFKSSDMVAELQKAQQKKADEEMAAKMKAPRKKKAKAVVEDDATSSGVGDVTSNLNDAATQALKVLETLAELKDEALADGKIKSEADAKKIEQQALEATLTDEQKNSEQFMKMLKQMTEAEANVEVANARQLSASEEAMMKKLQRGKSTKQQKIIERAFQEQSFVENVQNLAKKQQEDTMAAKLAAGRKKKAKKAEEEEKTPSHDDASSAPAASDSSAGGGTSMMDQALKVMEQFEKTSGGQPVNAQAVEATLTEEQKNNDQFMAMLKQMTEAEANLEMANDRQMSAAEEAMLKKLQKGKSTKQQKLIEKLFQEQSFVENVQKQNAKQQEDAMLAKLAKGKKKKKGAEEPEEQKEQAGADASAAAPKKKTVGKIKIAVQAAADSAAYLDATVAALLAVEEARFQGRTPLSQEDSEHLQTVACADWLTEDQHANTAFTDALRKNVEALMTSAYPQPKHDLTDDEKDLLRRLAVGKSPFHAQLLDSLIQHPPTSERLLAMDSQKQDDAQLAKILQQKQAKKKELALHQAAADAAAQLDAVVAALSYIEEARDAAVKEGRVVTPEEIAQAENKAAEDTLTPEQRGDAEFMKLFRNMIQEAAAREQAQSRSLNAADEALMRKLMKGKTTQQSKLIESMFKDIGLVEQLRALEQAKSEAAMAAKLLQAKNKAKREADAAAEAAAEGANPQEAAQAQQQVEAEAVQQQAKEDMQAAVGIDAAKEFAAMLKQVSEQQANQDLARSRQADAQANALMAKLAKGKSTKHQKLIEKAFTESGLVDQARDTAQKKQDDELAARLAAGRRKKKTEPTPEPVKQEEKYPEPVVATTAAAVEAPVVDYLEQKYGEMLAGEQASAAATDSAATAAQAVLENQEAIAQATELGMSAGADGVEVAEIAAHAAALGLSPDQITAAATAAAAVAGMAGADSGEMDHANFMELFRKATEDAAAEQVRRKQQQNNQDDAFMRKLMEGKKTKQQKMVEKQMADILAAQEKAKSFQGSQDAEMMAKLARGKAKKAAAAGAVPAVEDANRLAAEALASEMLLSGDSHEKSSLAQAQDEIEQILAAPTILDELLAVSEAQMEEITKQSKETGISEAEIIEANKEALELDNFAAELMLQKAREAEAQGDMEGAAAFMDMYKRMIEEGLSKDASVKKQLSAAEEAMMRKLMQGKTTKQQKLIEKAFQNSALVDAIMNQEQARQQALMEAKLAQGKLRKKNDAKMKQAEEAFAKLRKIFLGAIKKLDASNIIRQLDEVHSLVEEGFLDLNKPVKESGETMLHQASKYGRSEVVEWLVKLGQSKPNLQNALGQSPLHYAALALDPEGPDKISQDAAATACMLLIENGGDVNLSDLQLETPLSIAARLGFDLSNLANTPEALAALALQRQKDSAAARFQEMTSETSTTNNDMLQEEASKAASIAAQVAAETAAKLAQQQAQQAQQSAAVPIDPNTGLPMTQQQLQFQKEELENLMNEEKLEILALQAPPQGEKLDPAKTKAANLVFIQLCDLFKDINNPRNEFEATGLIKNNLELIREGYLDLSKPVKNKQDGSTLLHTAVFHQKLALVRQLLQNRADPNKITMTGETPLHIACSLADREPHGKAIVSLLLEAGARRDLRDFKNGHTPFENAPNKELRKWMEEWQPLAERQRLALANQMGGLDELLSKNAANLKNAAYSAENSFLEKLMKGKLTKQGRMLDDALKHNDLLNARTLTEQQKQLEAMQARLAKGRAKKAGGMMQQEDLTSLQTGSKEEIMAKKKQAFMEDMLLQELSEPTQDKIILTAEKWSDHANGLNGLDIAVLTKLRGMPIADAMRLLAQEITHAQSEQLRLNQAINAPGLDDIQALEYERQFNIADCNADIYSDLTKNMLEAEKKRGDALLEKSPSAGMTEEDLQVQAAQERLEAKKAKKAAAKAAQGGLPQSMLEAIAQLFSEYIAANTGYEVEPTLILQGALPMEDLQTYQLDVETIETMLSATEIDPCKLFLAKQTLVNEAVSQNMSRMLLDDALPQQQREEAEVHAKLCKSNESLYEGLMNILSQDLSLPAAGSAAAMQLQQEEELANQRIQEKLDAKEARQRDLVHPDTGLSVNMQIQDQVLHAMRELAAEFLGMHIDQIQDMNQDQIQQALAKAGVNVDILDELRKLSEAEAGKWLAKEMARNEAESDMLRKLLLGSKLSDKKRAELLARQKQLDAAADLYNDLLSTLLTGEKKKYAHLSAEEQLAQDRLLAKLAARRRKQEQQELAERKRRQEEEVALAVAMEREKQEKDGHAKEEPKEVPVTDENGDPVLLPDGSVQMQLVYEDSSLGIDASPSEILAKQGVMHQLLADNPQVFEGLQSLAAEHLGIAADELKKMTTEEVSMLLVEKGVDFNLLDYLKTLSNEEAAAHLAREMARAEAEAKMLRKLLQGKGLTPEQREDLLARQKALEDNAKMYEDMLRDLLTGEQKKYANMTAEERAAHDAMMAKLALRKAREVAKLKEVNQVDENSVLLQLFDDLSTKGPYECRACQTQNDATARSCKFCRKSRAETLTLPEMVLWHAHRMVHQCSCPMSVIEVVHRSIGPCTKKNFLQFMQATLIACNRDSHVFWDLCGVDSDQFGCLGSGASELVWGFNDWDVEGMRYHVFRDKHLDETMHDYIGWNDFREECVQMPTITDYQ